jgi:glycosyltransferase involved in cell wall biosynthesis
VGIDELIEDNKSGYIYKRFDYDFAAKLIVSILQNKANIQELVSRAKAKSIEEHSCPEIMAREYLDIYSSIMVYGPYGMIRK